MSEPRRAARTAGAPRRAVKAPAGPRRTRGGWEPVGTASDRRAIEDDRRTARGVRTRTAIVAAARTVFERDGYLDANVDAIVSEAKVARGSFYTYFPSKLEVFRVLFAESSAIIDDLVAPPAGGAPTDPVSALSDSNRRFLEYYRDNSALQRLVDQADVFDQELRAARLARRHHHVERVAQTIGRWQKRGVADPAVDPQAAAAALVSMTVDFCYWRFVGHEFSYDDETALDTLNDIWVKALDLRRRPRPSWLTR